MKTIIKTLVLSLVTIGQIAVANANLDLSGSHRGKTITGEEVQLLVTKTPFREGSYIAALVRSNTNLLGGSEIKKVALYRVDPLQTNSFDMTPLNVTSDGEIGINHPDPSLVMNFQGFRDRNVKKPMFSISVSNGQNPNKSFENPMLFEAWDTPSLQIIPLQGGQYFKGWNLAMSLSNEDALFDSNASSMLQGNLGGNFIIQQKQPSLYTLKAITVGASGVSSEQIPRVISLFIKNGPSVFMVLVHPSNNSDLIVIQQK